MKRGYGGIGGEGEIKKEADEMYQNVFKISILLKFNTPLFQMINEIDRKYET